MIGETVMSDSRKKLYKMVLVGVMAAVIFVLTYFVRIEIPTPTGPTNLKIANAFCLAAGMLFGGIYGGLAAGIGSMVFDILNPVYITSAPFTFAFFFTMAAVCGFISHSGGKNGRNLPRNILGAACGAVSYWVLYISKSVITLILAGSEFVPAVVATAPKMITSGINVFTGIIISVIIYVPLSKALRKTGVL